MQKVMDIKARSKFMKLICQIISVYLFMFVLMVTTIASLAAWNWWSNNKRYITTHPNSSYDFVIVGGGTAGCVLAARLSENQNHSVLLVEAGGHFSWLASIPLAVPLLQGSANDWGYRTVPQIHSSWGLWNNISAWPRGKGLGGSGQMNYLLHFPGNPEDFNRWEMSGASGWSFENLNLYMDKLLGITNLQDTHCSTKSSSLLTNLKNQTISHYCSKNSKDMKVNIYVTQNDTKFSPLLEAFQSAGESHGLDVTSAKSTVLEGERWSSLRGFLKPVLQRSNLDVITSTRTMKLLFSEIENKSKMQVAGVMLQNSEKRTWHVHSTRGVILSAGTIETPRVLMLSGIGPSNRLQDMGIKVYQDLPVGKNLHDHMNVPLYVSLEAPVSITLRKLLSTTQFWKYIRHGKGYFSTSGIVGVGSTKDNQLGIVLFGLGTPDEQLLCDIANYKPDTFRALFPFSGNSSQEGFVFLISCLQPKSRGEITLNSRNPDDPLMIDPKYLQEEEDLKCITRGVHLADKLVNSPSFHRLGARLHLPALPECKQFKHDVSDRQYTECMIRTVAITGHHPGGTCKMGNHYDNTTVVDPYLRVHGTENLYVMDASILPTPVSGHPNSVLIAMADRAADLIIGRHSNNFNEKI